MSTTDEEAYKRWKRRIPLLYDWFLNTSLTWPSLACRWGPTVNEQAFKWTQRIYVSEQVSDKRDCNKLCVWTADLCKPMVCSAESCATWCDVKSAHIKQHKTIFHPGEVNKIRDLAVLPDIIITHTDAPELLVWNLAAQPDRKQGGEGRSRRERQVSVPELKLMGHEDDAKFAMDTASAAPVVASGGDDGLVLTWNLADAQSSLAGSSGGDTSPTLAASVRLRGHSATIESVSMKKGSAEQLVSVGDDALLLVWDTRTGTQPQLRVEEAHGQGVDIHCVHWNPLNENLLVSGCSSGTLKVWDLRKLGGGGGGGAMLQLPAVSEGETLNVEWNPNRASVFASGGADQAVCLWDLERSADARGYRPLPGVPLELMFQHAGHRSQVVDIQWHASDTWTMMSVSDESHLDKGGGTLNLWRPISLITRPFDEAVSMLEQYREYIISGKKPQLSKDDPGAAAAAGPAPNCSAPQSGGDNAPAPAGPPASPPAAGAPAAAEPAAQRAATSAPGASSEPAPGGTATLPPPIDSGPAADSALATPDAEPSGDPARAADDGGGATATNPPADVEMSDAPEASASLPAAASDAASDAPAP